MSYCQMDGNPSLVSEMWFEALSGGRLSMKHAPGKARGDKLKMLSSHILTDPRMAGLGAPFNPSVVDVGGTLHVSVRLWGLAENMTRNLLSQWSGKHLESGGFLANKSKHADPAYGFEDLRLFTYQGRLMAVAAISTRSTTGSPRTRQALITIEDGNITEVYEMPSGRHEKNWMPCVYGDKLRLIYSTDPLTVLDWDPIKKVTNPMPSEIPPVDGLIRGGSQLVPYKSGWLAVVHQVHTAAPKVGVYVHKFAHFDKALTSVKLSAPFYLRHVGIEFVSGLARHGGRYVMTYGVADKEAWLSEVEPAVIEDMFSRESEASEIVPVTLISANRENQPVPVFYKQPAKPQRPPPETVPLHGNYLLHLLT
jgi:predicted GH43/DUF377 family glycosyl hydrolase